MKSTVLSNSQTNGLRTVLPGKQVRSAALSSIALGGAEGQRILERTYNVLITTPE
jgi:hypothetical protein